MRGKQSLRNPEKDVNQMTIFNISPKPYGRHATPESIREHGLTLTIKGERVETGNNRDGWKRLPKGKMLTVNNVTCVWVPSDGDGFTIKNGWEDDSVRVRGEGALIFGVYVGETIYPMEDGPLTVDDLVNWFAMVKRLDTLFRSI